MDHEHNPQILMALFCATMRIQLDLPPAKVERMKELMEDLGVETYKELFNNALALLDWSVEQVQDKRVIAGLLVNENSYRELVMPALQNAARRPKREHEHSQP